MQEYDAIVIGAGQPGGPLAGALAQAGKRVALIERDEVGGTCVNVGCTPTKTMLASAGVAHLARRASEYGVNVESVEVDFERVRERKRSVVEKFRGGSRRSLERIDGLDLHFGDARFVGDRKVEVSRAGVSSQIQAPIVIIDAGTRPATPPLPGLDEIDYLDSTSIMELDHLPSHLLVMGGGYVGLEFAQMFRRFGSQVTVLQRGGQLLSREDMDVAASLEEILSDEGVEVFTDVQVASASEKAGGLELTMEVAGEPMRVEGSHLLMAVGRVPNSDTLDLEAAGVATDESGYVVVDEQLRTSAPGIWAAGDITGGPAFTHVAYDDYRILRDWLLEGRGRTTSERQIPYTLYTDPQLGRVGLTEREARASGRRIAVAKMPAERGARAIETANTRGIWKAIIDPDSEQILGAAILGQEGGEVMSVIQVAMMAGLSYKALRDGVFAHPSYAESLNTLFTSSNLD